MVRSLGPTSLLAVGDSPDSPVAAVTELVQVDGRFIIETVPDAETGLDRLGSGSFDCVVATPELPTVDVIEFLRTVRRAHPNLPVVLLTNAEADGFTERALNAGATDVVPAAAGATLLETRIENAVGRHRAAEQPQYEEIIETLPVGVYRSVLAPDGDIVGANPAMARLFRADSAADLLGTEAATLYRDEADRQRFLERLESNSIVRDMEVAAQTLDGGERWVSITAVRTTDEGRTYADGIVREIDDRKQRETELSMFRRAVEASGHSVYFTDRTGAIEYVNSAFEETTGYTAEEAVGQTPQILKSGEHGPEFYESLWETILSGEVWRDEIVNHTKHGERYVADQTIAPVEGPDGDIERFVAINIDITERKEREQTLEQFRSAVEHAGHAVLITDSKGTIEYVNDAFEEMSGYSAAEAIGQSPSILKSGEHDHDFYRRLWETVLSGDVWHGEVINERKNGGQYVVDQTIAPITDAGEITGFVAINRDITELKAYERKLEEQNERLQQYGHSVAHDLRNPLTLLKGHLDDFETVADDGPVDPETVERRCRDAREVVDRMELLIDDLLTMAEQGQRVLEFETVSLEAVADEAWEQVQTAEADLTVTDSPIEADPDRLRELLSNLFRNAIEHAGEDIAVRVGPLDFVEGFFVEDDGPGIPPDERDRVLDRGFTTDEEGTGFGLAIVEEIARAHEWTVDVTEGSEGGARFEFRPETN
ncbi:receiver/sensor box histidine kinase [Natronomonas pharaonis DSM 2160]|uniref:histidine kinase n=1 Tax=Natronomonas pharaonis (strain ATCC 35678 / DSM 2160 / CIP 103997 / JCM 8858 / NBRC 14720 / NCIMB 2260 / Gabara) TaxID=348780 RepID=A0A1U7EU94_NATPD|nr:PAS domain S-box protein [Natronomonas pharaonis]CAI48522.1 receiver/sensor box histidine kinase [Natronomonas pharaonis DSM 2160]